jgi:hypothetical protein
MYDDFDDTLPLPEEVEQEFREKAGDNLTAVGGCPTTVLNPPDKMLR